MMHLLLPPDCVNGKWAFLLQECVCVTRMEGPMDKGESEVACSTVSLQTERPRSSTCICANTL
jgi:hypothetical protein